MGTGMLVFTKNELINFGGSEKLFSNVSFACFAMLLYNAVLIRLKRFFGLYENQPAYFYCKLVGWFYIGRRLSLNLFLIKVFLSTF